MSNKEPGSTQLRDTIVSDIKAIEYFIETQDNRERAESIDPATMMFINAKPKGWQEQEWFDFMKNTLAMAWTSHQ